jgi:hemolysin activation/secretion protein
LRLGLIVALGWAAGPALAQTAGELPQPSLAPVPQQRLTGALVFSGQPGLAAPPGADRLSVAIRSVSVSGTLAGMQPATAALQARLTRGRISVAEIFAAASDLERAYADAGYVLARVVLPAQTLNDGGTLKLTVVNGFVEKVDTSAVPEKLRRRLEEVTEPLVGKRGLTLREIERQLLIAGDTYGVALGSALAAGATPGGTVIILQPKYRGITGFAGFDNSFADELGKVNFSAGLEFNGFLGFGEAFYLRASGNPRLGDNGWFDDHPRLRTLAAGAVFPIGQNGLTFNVEVTDSRTNPDSRPTTASAYQRLSFRAYYPWRRSRQLNLTSQVSLDLVKDDLDLLTVAGFLPLHEDRISVLRFSTDALVATGDNAVLEAGMTASFGLDAFGARSADEAAERGIPLSRDGADAVFKKLELSLRWRKQVTPKLTFSLAGRAQTSFGDALVSSEQFGIATTQDLSAFDEGTVSGDSGWVVRAELSSPSEVKTGVGPLQLRPYLFGAAGKVWQANPEAGEAESIYATSVGIGLEVIKIRDPRFSSASLVMELARGTRDDGGKDDTRLTLVGSYRF